MDRHGRNICYLCFSHVSLVTMISLLAMNCQLFLNVRGEDGQFNNQQSLQSRRVLTSGSSSSNVSETHSLLEFRRSIVDVNGTLASWNTVQNSNVCRWVGVQCDRSGHVSTLDLSGMGLSGAISPSLGSLQYLTSLILSINSFHGEVPSSLSSLRHLRNLDLSQNNLTHFPSRFSNWTALTSLNLSRNALTGFIPVDIGNLHNLSKIDLQFNFLTSSIPASLGNCSSLSWLDLGSNQFVGTIPADLGRLHKLTALRLQTNNLTGPVPSSIYNISALKDLDLENNLLSGKISSDIGRLKNLTSLRLNVNNFSGSVPSSIGNLSSLETLMVGGAALLGGFSVAGPDSPLGGEWLTGHIPVELGKLHNLQSLWFYRTNCTGTLPVELGNLKKLRFLWMFHNLHLTPSVIPSTFANLTNLYALEILKNNLQGNIPPWIGNLVNVGWLGLRFNQLTGQLPSEIGNLTSLWRFLVSKNSLTGPVIPELGKLTKLSDLGLDQNWFSGHLPTALGNISDLINLFLYENNLTGTIPPAMLTKMPLLRYFCLNNNQLSGPIPGEIGSMTGLHYVDLSFNELSGPIPPEIGQCIGIIHFNISHNRISGHLPISSLEKLELLESFIVNDNLLEGPVPPSNGTFRNVTVNYARNVGLCGPQLDKNCSSPVQPAPTKQECHGLSFGCNRAWIYIILAGGGTVLVAILACLCLLCLKKSGRKSCATLQTSGCKEVGGDFPDVNLFLEDLTVTVEDLWEATDGFSKENILGRGGSSTVYKAMLVNQTKNLIAVKCLSLDDMAGGSTTQDLHNELKILGTVRHRNLVRLYGVCATPTFKALLLEYVSGGSLQLHLHPSNEQRRRQLTVESRIRIAMGVADALVYLHNDAHHQIIHRDLKPSNILLDSKGNPKVADFGISKFVNRGRDGEVTTSTLFGTTGYIPPEYATSSMVSTKGDIYSFGVILLEMLTGRAPTDNRFGKDETLVDWVQKASPDRIKDILDESLERELVAYEPGLNLLAHVGLLCTQSSPKARPSISDVKQLLLGAKNAKAFKVGQNDYPTLQELAEQPTFNKPIWISCARQSSNFPTTLRPSRKSEVYPIYRDSPGEGSSSGASSPMLSSPDSCSWDERANL